MGVIEEEKEEERGLGKVLQGLEGRSEG